MTLQPEIFGLADSTEAVKWSFISVGIWWALFLIPIIKNVSVPVIETQSNVLVKSIRKNIATLSKIKAEKNVFIFLIAFFLYIDGVHTVMAMASDFALNLNLESSSIIIGLILVQFVAFPSTIAWSYIAEKKGEKNVLYVNILGYLALVSYSVSLSNATEFYVMACMVGSIQGGIQAVSRSLFAKIIPIKSAGEFFGFYNMFGRAGAFLGPLLVAIFVSTFDSASYGLIPIAVLFILGGLLLIRVKT
jgi:UMF1 family MFS transporter